MKRYRQVYQCPDCGKIYRSERIPKRNNGGYDFGPLVCGRCGHIGDFKKPSARPRLFGLKGWEVRNEVKK